jgi:hypothetical protein
MMRTGAPLAKALMAHGSGRNADVDAFRDYRLLGLSAALCVEKIEREPAS